MKKLLFILGLCLIFTSCGNKSEQDLEKMTSSGVVLVQNQSYYEVVLSNGESVYFSSFTDDGNLKDMTFDKDSIKYAIAYGTGFFISNEGEIATNAHVVSNTVADKDVNKSVAEIISALKKLVVAVYNDYEEKYQRAQLAYNFAYQSPSVSAEDFYRIRDYRDEIQEQMEECASLYNTLDEIRASDSEIKYHNEVSIAYNDTYVTNTKDFISCVVKKADTENDIAIIQLKDKNTPADKYVFTVENEDPLEKYTWIEKMTKKISEDKNSKLFMSSFNLGPTLALTEEGIKLQFNSGSISQKTNNQIMYSIPALPGSSGSPVINLKGQLVAINYAGLRDTQNFNYGIRIKHLRNLIDK
ncbi:MAG: serine protease [Prevotella sp.]|nr:serine protease [Prevotella sp.]